MEEGREDRDFLGGYDDANSELDEDRGHLPSGIYDQFSKDDGSGSDVRECGGSCFSGSTATDPGSGRGRARKMLGGRSARKRGRRRRNQALVSPQNVRARRVARKVASPV